MKSPVIVFNSCLSEGAASSLNSTRNSVTRQILCWGEVVNVIGLALKFKMRFVVVIVKVFPIQAGKKEEEIECDKCNVTNVIKNLNKEGDICNK